MAQQSAVEWYAEEHHKLLIQLENKELTIGEYAVKHHDIIQKAKSIEDLTSLKKRNTELQDQVLLNDTTKKPMSKNNMTVVDWFISKINTGFQLIEIEWNESMIEEGKQMHEEQMFEAFKAGQNSMEEGGKSFDIYYKQTYGKANGS